MKTSDFEFSEAPGNSGNEPDKEEGLFILIDKPIGYSSAKVVNILKKGLNIKKAGHSGTLDPNATGLLIICTGRKTKDLNSLIEVDKEYEGVLVLGGKTKSFDTESEVYDEKNTDGVTDDIIIDTAKSFEGETKQLPPMFSAIKYKGKPLYKYARKDCEIERAPRTINIKEFKILNISLPEVSFRVSCSKGTYIRALANDFGEKIGVGAYLKSLRRTRVGNYEVKDAAELDEYIRQNRLNPVFQKM